VNQEALDPLIKTVLSQGWTLDRLGNVLRAILRAGLYELKGFPETPRIVVINEYVNLTKAFYSGQESGFVNAALDKLAKKLGETSKTSGA
jgi:N utilization substance protein B